MGKEIARVERPDYKPRELTKQDETDIRGILKKIWADSYPKMQKRLYFSDTFPAIWALILDRGAGRFYVMTWKRDKDKKFEMFVYTMDGKPVKKVFIPFVLADPLRPYPFYIYNGRLYQLIENEDEEWELHINKID